MTNKDIRVKIALSGFTKTQIAHKIPIHKTTLSRWLRVEMTAIQTAKIEKAIKELTNDTTTTKGTRA